MGLMACICAMYDSWVLIVPYHSFRPTSVAQALQTRFRTHSTLFWRIESVFFGCILTIKPAVSETADSISV